MHFQKCNLLQSLGRAYTDEDGQSPDGSSIHAPIHPTPTDSVHLDSISKESFTGRPALGSNNVQTYSALEFWNLECCRLLWVILWKIDSGKLCTSVSGHLHFQTSLSGPDSVPEHDLPVEPGQSHKPSSRNSKTSGTGSVKCTGKTRSSPKPCSKLHKIGQ